MIKDERRKNISATLFWRLRVRGSSRPIKTAIYWPHSYGHQRCVFLVLLMLSRRLGGSAFCWVLAFSTTSFHQRVSQTTGVPRAPLAGCGFPYHISSLTHLISNFYDLQLNRGLRGPLRLGIALIPSTSCLHRVI